MAFGQEDPSRTEKATPKQVRKQREKGNVPKGQEISKVMTLLAGLVALRFLIGWVYGQLHEVYTWFFRQGLSLDINQSTAYGLLLFCMKKVTLIVLPIMLIVAFIAFVTLRLQVGQLWTTKVFKPKFGKMFNIMKGVKKLMFSPEAFVRLARNLLIASAVAIAPYLVLMEEKENLLPLFYASPARRGHLHPVERPSSMVTYALVPMLLIAILDLWYTRWNHNEQLKMTKDEVKDERKQMEGDPKIKQQQKHADDAVHGQAHDAAGAQGRRGGHQPHPLRRGPALRPVMEAPGPLVLAKGVDSMAEKHQGQSPKEAGVPIKREQAPGTGLV